MLTTEEALKEGFEFIKDNETDDASFQGMKDALGLTADNGYWNFKFGDGYELNFEPLLFDNQMYVALYKDQELLTEKVVVKPGYIKEENAK